MLASSIAAILLASSPWTPKDTSYEVAYGVLTVVDWRQTVTIAKYPNKWHEHNPVLGQHPNRNTVDAWFAGTLLFHAGMSRILPQPYRRLYQIFSIGYEGGFVINNARIGISMTF